LDVILGKKIIELNKLEQILEEKEETASFSLNSSTSSKQSDDIEALLESKSQKNTSSYQENNGPET